MRKITRKQRHAAMLEQGMHSGNTDAKFDPPPEPKSSQCRYWPACACGYQNGRTPRPDPCGKAARSPIGIAGAADE